MRRVMFGICALALTALVVTQFVWAGPPGPDGAHKVAICHKGEVIVVDAKAVDAHFRNHEDCFADGEASKGDECRCCELVEATNSCDGGCQDEDEVCTEDRDPGECDGAKEEVEGDCVDNSGPCDSNNPCDDDVECGGSVPAERGVCEGGDNDGGDCGSDADCPDAVTCDCD